MQDNLIIFENDGEEEIMVEVMDISRDGFGYRSGGEERKTKKVQKAFEKALAPLKTVANKTLMTLTEIAESPEEVSLEMGIKVGGEGNMYLAKVTGDVHFKVQIKWTQDSIEKAKQAKIA